MQEDSVNVAKVLFGGLVLTILVFSPSYAHSKVEDRQYQEEPIQLVHTMFF